MIPLAGQSESSLKDKASSIFGGLAKSYDLTLDLATLLQDRYWKEWMVEKAAPRPTDAILDLGCGTCVMEERLREMGCRAVGLDLTEKMLRMGQKKGLGSAQDLLTGDAEALPFLDSSFDLILSCYVVKYCDGSKFAAEVARVLKPGGRLVLYDFVRPRGPLRLFLELYIYGATRWAGKLLGPVDGGVAYTFRELPKIIQGSAWEEALVQKLARNGLELVERRLLSGGAVEAFVAQKANGMGRPFLNSRLQSLTR